MGLTPTQEEAMDCSPHLEWGLTLEGAREVELSYAGGCDARLVSKGSKDWLSDLRASQELVLPRRGSETPSLRGKNVYVHVHREHIYEAALILREAIAADPQTRAMVLLKPEDELAWLKAIGPAARASLVMELGGEGSVGGCGLEPRRC